MTVCVGDADAPPAPARLGVIDRGIIGEVDDAELRDIQPTHCLNQSIRVDDQVPLGRDQSHFGIQSFVFGVEHIEQRALADALLFANTGQGCARGAHLHLIGLELGLGCGKIRPCRDGRLLCLGAGLLDLLQSLHVRMFGLPHAGIDFAASRIDRNVQTPLNSRRFVLVDRARGIEAARMRGIERHGRQQLAPDEVDGMARRLFVIEGADDGGLLFQGDRNGFLD